MIRSIPATLVALALVAPVAGAYWSSHGGFEPDYPEDVTLSLMFSEPDVDPDLGHRQVYFNVVNTWNTVGVNPNAGALHSRVLAPGFQSPVAFLGVWKDCNEDGYLGMAETVVLQYRSELLLDDSICPSGNVFNSDGWVHEFLWIGPKDNVPIWGEAGANPRSINDTGAFVWGDAGRPSDAQGAGASCFVNPQTGTFSGTGALIAFADCGNGRQLARATQADPTGLIAFEDPEKPQCSESSLLNVRQNVFHDDPQCPSGQTPILGGGTGHSMFTVWDCSSETPVEVADPVGLTLVLPTGQIGLTEGDITIGTGDEEGNFLSAAVPNGAAPSVDPSGSALDGANMAIGAITGGCASQDAGLGLVPEVAEQPVKQGDLKRESDFYFWYNHDAFGAAFLASDIVGGPAAGLPPSAGVDYFHNVQALGPSWTSPIAITATPPLLAGDLSGEDAVYYTFYARVSAPGLVLPGGGATYGAEWCGSDFTTERDVRGFDCNAANWWREDKGASAMPTDLWNGRALGQRPGDAYNLRDTDCYDGSATDAAPGVGLGLTLLSEGGPCASYAG